MQKISSRKQKIVIAYAENFLAQMALHVNSKCWALSENNDILSSRPAREDDAF